MSKGLAISKATWMGIWVVAVLQTLIGGIPSAHSWRFDIQFPGVDVALFLMAVTGPLPLMFGASGGIFMIVVTVLTNVLVYAALVSLVLVVLKALRKKQS